MSRVPDFKKFVIEEKDEDSELRSMGFPPDEPFDDRIIKAYSGFIDDEEVIAAISLLKTKAEYYIEKSQIDLNDADDSAAWEEYIESVYDGGIDQIGWFEYVAVVSQ